MSEATVTAAAAGGSAALRVLIVDDEPLARQRLRSLLEASLEPQARVVGEAGDARQALALLVSTPCDLVLADIVMPGGSGLRLADELRRQSALPGAPSLVFVTAHAEHALQAFELDAADYLTKPVRRERLQAALQRVAQRRGLAAPSASDGPVLVVSDRGRVLRVPQAQLLYLKAGLKYVSLCSQQGSWLLDEPLADLEKRLGEGFLRVHRNAVVAVSAVRALEHGALPAMAAGEGLAEAAPAPEAGAEVEQGWFVRLANGEALAVSRRQLPAVRELLAKAGR